MQPPSQDLSPSKSASSPRSKLEIFKDLASGMHGFVLIIAAVGGWMSSIYLTFSHAETEKNRIAADTALIGLQKAQLESRQFERNVHTKLVDVQLDAKQLKYAKEPGHFIHASITLTNKGQLRTMLDISECLAVMKLKDAKKFELDPGSLIKYSMPSANKASENKKQLVLLLPGEIQRESIVFKVDSPGIYYCEFFSTIDPSDKYTHEYMGLEKPEDVKKVPYKDLPSWSTSTHVAVE
jgi:hypothetical protein